MHLYLLITCWKQTQMKVCTAKFLMNQCSHLFDDLKKWTVRAVCTIWLVRTVRCSHDFACSHCSLFALFGPWCWEFPNSRLSSSQIVNKNVCDRHLQLVTEILFRSLSITNIYSKTPTGPESLQLAIRLIKISLSVLDLCHPFEDFAFGPVRNQANITQTWSNHNTT